MNDLWSHSHDWDNGYAKGHKDGYYQGRADAIDEFAKRIAESDVDIEPSRQIIFDIAKEMKGNSTEHPDDKADREKKIWESGEC